MPVPVNKSTLSANKSTFQDNNRSQCGYRYKNSEEYLVN